MSLSVKEILNIGRRQLEESDIADAAVDCKLLYCYLMNISSAQLILEYQKFLYLFHNIEENCSGFKFFPRLWQWFLLHL